MKTHAVSQQLEERIEIVDGDMHKLPFPENSFDLVWAEGAAYIMGFHKALVSWRKLLKQDGYVAVSELVWLRADPPHPNLRSVADGGHWRWTGSTSENFINFRALSCHLRFLHNGLQHHELRLPSRIMHCRHCDFSTRWIRCAQVDQPQESKSWESKLCRSAGIIEFLMLREAISPASSPAAKFTFHSLCVFPEVAGPCTT